MIVFAIETSCDETSLAVIRDGQVLSNFVSSQVKLHAEYGGVVPELATREHLRNLLPLARSALAAAHLTPSDLDGVAATQGPGLPSALLVGFQAGQAFAFALRKPFIGIHHHEAHLYSPWIQGEPPRADFQSFEPCISLVVSGGHTMLVHVPRFLEHCVLGVTVDDAAGECFDKTAKLVGLPYPGGPHIDRLAAEGNPKAHSFPRPMLNDSTDDFSFSGLKTAVRYFVRDHPRFLDEPRNLKDLCASIQAAIVEVLVAKTIRAAKRTGVRLVTGAGGVVCNRELRRSLTEACGRCGLRLKLADPCFSTDNAGMIGILAEQRFLAGQPPASLDSEVQPGWELEEIIQEF